MLLEFLDGGLELRNRGADVGQLDDVGLWRGGQFAQFGEVVADLLVLAQVLGEACQDAACEGDVPCFHSDAGGGSEGFDDRKQGVGCQRRCFVGEGVNDL
ncbi:hypothetical protein D3C84_592530 [compost metagenome]